MEESLRLWIPRVVVAACLLGAGVLVAHEPASARQDPCEELCRNYEKCGSEGRAGCWPVTEEVLCSGTWGPEEECEMHWCEDVERCGN